MHHRITAWFLSIAMMLGILSGLTYHADAATENVNIYKYTNKDCSMPQTGIAKTVFFLVQFPDYQNTDETLTAKSVQAKYFSTTSKDSITGFYKASSFGNLTVKGNVYGWYTAKKNRNEYCGQQGSLALYREVMEYYDRKGLDFSRFDGDADGIIDGIYLMFAGGDTGYGTDWWSCAGYLQDSSYKIDGKQLGSYIKLAEDDLPTAIHETGHTLGLWDYYTESETGEACYGIGGYDIMDDNLGDHNALSKILLGWITPNVVVGGEWEESMVVPLENHENGGCVVYFPDGAVNYGGKYYVIEYLTQSGGYADVSSLANGKFRILLVNGTDEKGRLKVKLIEADDDADVTGLCRWKADDLFSHGDVFSGADGMRILFFRENEDSAALCFLSDREGTTSSEGLQCETKSILLKKKMAFSPVVIDHKGMGVHQNLDWISVNEQVATVSQSGLITAKNAGHTAVIGSQENTDGSVDFVILEVYVVSSLKDISFAPKQSELTPGEKTKMTIQVCGEEITSELKITWSVSNSRLSVSSKGTVSAKKVGVSTVKATLESGLILTCRLTVDFTPITAKVKQTKAGYASVRWNKISGASGYRIYRYNYKTKQDPVLIATVKNSETVTYIDKKVKTDVGYAYQVFAYDSSQSKTIFSQGSDWINFKLTK